MPNYYVASRLIQIAAERIDGERIELLFEDDVNIDHRHQLTLARCLAQIEVAVHDLKALAYDLRELDDHDDWLETTRELLDDDPDYMDNRVAAELFRD